jgi:hypothetical protein
VVVCAANPVDLLIDPRYRSMAAFMRLMTMRGWQDHFDALFLTPNLNSMLLYEKALKFLQPISLKAFGYPVRVSPVLRRLVGWELRPLAWPVDQLLRAGQLRLPSHAQFHDEWPLAPELDDLFFRLRQLPGGIGERDAAFLAWRFRDSPRIEYRATFISIDGMLSGYYVTSVQSYLNFRVLFVIDLIGTSRVTRRDWLSVRARIISEARRTGCQLVFGLFNLGASRLRRTLGWPWARVPARLLPQPIPIFVNASGPSTPVSWSQCLLTAADLDVF